MEMLRCIYSSDQNNDLLTSSYSLTRTDIRGSAYEIFRSYLMDRWNSIIINAGLGNIVGRVCYYSRNRVFEFWVEHGCMSLRFFSCTLLEGLCLFLWLSIWKRLFSPTFNLCDHPYWKILKEISRADQYRKRTFYICRTAAGIITNTTL